MRDGEPNPLRSWHGAVAVLYLDDSGGEALHLDCRGLPRETRKRCCLLKILLGTKLRGLDAKKLLDLGADYVHPREDFGLLVSVKGRRHVGRGPRALLLVHARGSPVVVRPATDDTRTFRTFAFWWLRLAAFRRWYALAAADSFHLLRKLCEFATCSSLGLVANGFHL